MKTVVKELRITELAAAITQERREIGATCDIEVVAEKLRALSDADFEMLAKVRNI